MQLTSLGLGLQLRAHLILSGFSVSLILGYILPGFFTFQASQGKKMQASNLRGRFPRFNYNGKCASATQVPVSIFLFCIGCTLRLPDLTNKYTRYSALFKLFLIVSDIHGA
ncbi:unnamed protein product [Rangifer tarandus platyrhynchus]|uniref:Uncharacterized protein n=2 Tax=Rangifer tarandus platyrhynchus TaxID=3082113 RepID=A0AC59ZNX6_RANTA|nr:unnamed protein product [Rangifer tarandus platyrhynchus]